MLADDDRAGPNCAAGGHALDSMDSLAATPSVLRDPVAGQLELFLRFPRLAEVLPWVVLGAYPTPVSRLHLPAAAPGHGNPRGVELWAKREDLTSPHYGGNKVRTIEGHFGRALARGRRRIWATGAYGSNHALATAVHAARAGLDSGAILVPQPATATAHANLRALAATTCMISTAGHWLLRPAAAVRLLSDPAEVVMTPGGAIPLGALGHVSAALELAAQVARGELPAPAHVVVTAGSTATAAGLLVGLHLAAALEIGWRRPPQLVAVPVAPNPFASAPMIALLARATLRLLRNSLGADSGVADRIDASALRRGLRVDSHHNGAGYGHPSPSGEAARRLFQEATELAAQRPDLERPPLLDLVYTARSAAGMLALLPDAQGPVLHWMTKSAAPLAEASDTAIEKLPRPLRRWLAQPPVEAPLDAPPFDNG